MKPINILNKLNEANVIPKTKQINKINDILERLNDALVRVKINRNLDKEGNNLIIKYNRYGLKGHTKGIDIVLYKKDSRSNNHNIYLGLVKNNSNNREIVEYRVTIDNKPIGATIPSRKEVSNDYITAIAEDIIDKLLPLLENEVENNSCIGKVETMLDNALDEYGARLYNMNIYDKGNKVIANEIIDGNNIYIGKVKIDCTKSDNEIKRSINAAVNELFPSKQLDIFNND